MINALIRCYSTVGSNEQYEDCIRKMALELVSVTMVKAGFGLSISYFSFEPFRECAAWNSPACLPVGIRYAYDKMRQAQKLTAQNDEV